MKNSQVIRHRMEEIFKAEGIVRIVCDKHVYYMAENTITSYKFDDCGVSLVGRIRCTYQASCDFSMVYIPFESITALTGGIV